MGRGEVAAYEGPQDRVASVGSQGLVGGVPDQLSSFWVLHPPIIPVEGPRPRAAWREGDTVISSLHAML